ncbi:hypothetical protein NIES267_05680 [Calothrix parasitica NIES-267]|uniref:Uncharacterized protein n=1 Tax=Calothrix parasitica NIES-267 TaxID=1973488 RepID=A0A1Z4LIN6_9CYAN|nr:hypothetical protein NIES267_05680 [Calothrix parasitica NIES-267]
MNQLKLFLYCFLLFCAIVTPIIAECLRHRFYLKHRHMDITPGTQHISFWGSALPVFSLLILF